MKTTENQRSGSVCNLPTEPDYSGVTIIELEPEAQVADFNAAKQLADNKAETLLESAMLLSFHDGDKGFDSPQHGDECHAGSPIPAYIDYALSHDATLKIDIEKGRFIFFYLAV
ncbi:AF1514 family protein [Thiothrix lacustris]|uniref:AF1514 family protein n=1 Tax=Thiothrix lacustris TaxID=525917 RepID=UPI0027E546CA|nr:AF1514 family protein [Thiothrix lacustris]WMP17478.1 AF1514 family protein [Thiothrix lacustris]